MSLSRQDVAEIVDLLDQLDATELHLRTRHFTLRLRRDGPDGRWLQATAVTAEPHLLDPGDGEAASGAPDADPGPDAAGDTGPTPAGAPEEARAGLVAVRAPLMGTFYRAPKPGAPPFVEVGAAVEEHTVVGIVETMKLMNSVYAGARGRVTEIRLDNAQPAGQGDVLMWIEPERPG